MAATAVPELKVLQGEVFEFGDNLYDAGELTGDVRDIVKYTRRAMKVTEKIADISDKLHTVAVSGGTIAKVFAKIGILKPVADPFSKILFRVDDRVLAIEKKAKALDDKFEPYKDFLEKANTKLKLLEIQLKLESAAAEDLSDRMGLVNARLDSARTFVDSSVGVDTLGNLDPKIGEVKDRLNNLFRDMNTASGLAVVPLDAANTTIQEVKDAIDKMKIDVALNIDFGILEAFADALSEVGDAFEFLAEPLRAVYDAAGPVLDALGSIFGWILAPLEFILEAILEATGLQDLIDYLGDQIAGLLPDLNILDIFDLNFDLQFDLNFTNPFNFDIVNPLDGLLDDLQLPGFMSTVLGPATAGDDIHLGLLHSGGNEKVSGTRGDDFIVGGNGNDTLEGGEDADILIGGAGNDLLVGGNGSSKAANPDPRDIVIYSGSVNDYGIVSIVDSAGNPSGVWYVSDYRNNTDVNDGTDTLIGIEDVVFTDATIPIGELGSFIRTLSVDGTSRFVRVGSSNVFVTIDGQEIEARASNIADWVFGDRGFDHLSTGAGNDQLTSVANGPETIKLLQRPGDVLDGGEDNDTFLIGDGSGAWDIVLGGSGDDRIVYQAMPNGLVVFMAVGPEGTLFRPSSISIDVSFDGNLQAAVGAPRVGIIRDVEHINGTEHADHFWGTSAANKIDGNGGNDQIRGLGGNDILIGGAGSDTLAGDRGDDYLIGGDGNDQYVGGRGNDTIVANGGDVFYAAEAISDSYSKKVGLVDFKTTGYTDSNLDMPGGIVIQAARSAGIQHVSKYETSVLVGDRFGEDRLEDARVIVASTGADHITAANDIAQVIYANGGDDTLYSGDGLASVSFYGGEGDDVFYGQSDSDDRFFGGEGSDRVVVAGDLSVAGDVYFGDDNRAKSDVSKDVFDVSQSNYSWHIYLNSGSSNGTAVSKFPISAADFSDSDYIQATLGVNGVSKRPTQGPTGPESAYPGVPFNLRHPDANTQEPGGRAAIGEFEVFNGSMHRDVLTVGSPDGAVTAYGNDGADVLFSLQTGRDQLFGGRGNDVLGTLNQAFNADPESSNFDAGLVVRLDGGDGNDTLVAGDFREDFVGGDGIDRLTFEASKAAVTVNLQTGVLSGGSAEGDTELGVENLIGSQNDDRLTGDIGANLIVGWHGDDTIDGGAGDDALYGNGGADSLLGGDGNDMLHGGTGADTLDGGRGLDTASWNLYQESPKGILSRLTGETAGVDADLVTGVAGVDVLRNIENLQGGVGDDTLSGDALDNVLVGNNGDDLIDGRGGKDILVGGLGDDTLFGGADDDWLSGGAGINKLDGGAGIDALDYGITPYGITVEMAGVGSRANLASGLVTHHVEVRKAVWTDSLTMANDPLRGDGGTMAVGTDEVRYTYQVFDNGTDDPSDDTRRQEDPITPEQLFRLLNPTFAETEADLTPVRFLPRNNNLLPEQEFSLISRYEQAQDEFTSIEQIAGGDADDRILGNAEATEFHGGGGADTIDGGAGRDTASYAASAGGVAVDLGAATARGGDADGDVLTGIENLTGSAHGDMLAGDGGDNRLSGLGGNDTIKGGAGSDTAVMGYASTEVIVARAVGGVRIILADGGTILDSDFVADDVEFVAFTDTTLSAGDITGLIISGTSASELLNGTAIADNINGGAGDDTINGLGGDDRLFGQGDADSLEGGAGNDTLEGGAGADHVHGGSGNDLLIGGSGRDHFKGGTGDDIFVVNDAAELTIEAPGEGTDTVRTNVSLTLQANIEVLELTGAQGLAGTGNGGDNSLIGNGGANRLMGLGGDDTLRGGAGVDTLEGGGGDDVYLIEDGQDIVIEATGQGSDEIQSTVTLTLGANIEALVLTGTADIDGTGNALDNALTGNGGDNWLVGLAGSDRFHGSGGDDVMIGGGGADAVAYDFDLAAADFDFDDPDYILVYKPGGVDRLEGIETFEFADQTITTDALRLQVLPMQNVQLFAADYFVNDYGIDMSREGGGVQFLNVGPASQGSNRGNEFHFATEFKDDGGRALFGGSGFNDLTAGTANNFKVDFSGGNSSMLSVFGFRKPLLRMLDAEWSFWETNIFNGDDRVLGSYHADTLVGYAGDDTIFGGLGDKENYDISDTSNIPSPKPSTIRAPGQTATKASYLVNDGDDLIDGEGGNDLLDGGTGNDTIFGGHGDDKLWGGAISAKGAVPGGVPDTGRDVLDGGAGNDTLEGDGGDDILTGGTGDDTFVIENGMGQDVITDFGDGNDVLDLSRLSQAERDGIVDATGNDGVRLITLLDGSTVQVDSFSGNVAPLGQVLLSGAERQNGTLIADTSDLSDANGLGDFSYLWMRDGVAIPQATTDRHVLTQNDVGKQISVTVSFTDGKGFDEAVTTAASDFIANVNDAATGALVIDGPLFVGSELTARVADLADADGVGQLQYQWLRNGAEIVGERAATYQLEAVDTGAAITARVSFVDNYNSSETLVSAASSAVFGSARSGTAGSDVMIGTAGSDHLRGLGGSDRINGLAGRDALFGDAGDDHVHGDGYQPDFDLDIANQVYRLYQATLNRAPDKGGHASWSEILSTGAKTLPEVAAGFVGSPEFKAAYGGLDDTDFVKLLYQNVLERTVNDDDAGLLSWVKQLADGQPAANVVVGFSQSLEFKAKTLDAANLRAINSDAAGWTDDVYRLYLATLDRSPDQAGLEDWSDQLSKGAEFQSVVTGFVKSTEFKNTYGALDNKAFVKLLYSNVLDRTPPDDDAGLKGWVAQLDGGGAREVVVKGFSQSRENILATGDTLTDWVLSLGEHDRVHGGAGSNVMSGGALSDTFVFDRADSGTHRVLDLEPWDGIAFDGFGYASQSEAFGKMRQAGRDVIFEDQGTMITFRKAELESTIDALTDLTSDMIHI